MSDYHILCDSTTCRENENKARQKNKYKTKKAMLDAVEAVVKTDRPQEDQEE